MVKSHSRTHNVSKAGLLIGIVIALSLISGGYLIYATLPNATGASSGVSTCLYIGDVYSGSTQQLCSAHEVFGFTGFQPFSGYATVNGKNATIYDSETGASKPINRTAVLTTKITQGTMASATTSCTETLTLNGAILTTRTQNASFTSVPNLTTICSLARDGKVLVTQDLPKGNGSSTLIWSVTGKQTIKFTNGVVVQSPFSGVLGNLTITTVERMASSSSSSSSSTSLSSTSTSTSSSSSSSSNTITITSSSGGSTSNGTQTGSTSGRTGEATGANLPMPSITSDPTSQITGTSLNSASVSQEVTAVSTSVSDPNYVKATQTLITTTLTTNTVDVTIGGETTAVNVCLVGSCGYSPATDGTSATVTATVTKEDVAIYERTSADILRMFDAKTTADLTPYSRCAFFLQC